MKSASLSLYIPAEEIFGHVGQFQPNLLEESRTVSASKIIDTGEKICSEGLDAPLSPTFSADFF